MKKRKRAQKAPSWDPDSADQPKTRLAAQWSSWEDSPLCVVQEFTDDWTLRAEQKQNILYVCCVSDPASTPTKAAQGARHLITTITVENLQLSSPWDQHTQNLTKNSSASHTIWVKPTLQNEKRFFFFWTSLDEKWEQIWILHFFPCVFFMSAFCSLWPNCCLCCLWCVYLCLSRTKGLLWIYTGAQKHGMEK